MKYIKIARWTVAGLLCLQLTTYLTLSGHCLTRVAMNCRPERTHFRTGTFKWVYLVYVNTEDVSPGLAQDIKNEFEKRYDQVYYNDREIPKESVIYWNVDGKQKLAGYRDGYSYSIAFKNPGFMNIVVSHHDYEGSEAGCSRQGWYFWMFFWWVRVHTCYAAVS